MLAARSSVARSSTNARVICLLSRDRISGSAVSRPIATSRDPCKRLANSNQRLLINRGWDSTVTFVKDLTRSAIFGSSSGGTATGSKKLLALYNLILVGNGFSSFLSPFASWCGIALGGVGPSSVCRHRSQKMHLNGHSVPVRKIVRLGIRCPSSPRSSSCSRPLACHGSTDNLCARSRSLLGAGLVGCVLVKEVLSVAIALGVEDLSERLRCHGAFLKTPLGEGGKCSTQD